MSNRKSLSHLPVIILYSITNIYWELRQDLKGKWEEKTRINTSPLHYLSFSSSYKLEYVNIFVCQLISTPYAHPHLIFHFLRWKLRSRLRSKWKSKLGNFYTIPFSGAMHMNKRESKRERSGTCILYLQLHTHST